MCMPLLGYFILTTLSKQVPAFMHLCLILCSLSPAGIDSHCGGMMKKTLQPMMGVIQETCKLLMSSEGP